MQIEGTNIMVDKFTHKKGDVVQYIYFLSHFHTGTYSPSPRLFRPHDRTDTHLEPRDYLLFSHNETTAGRQVP